MKLLRGSRPRRLPGPFMCLLRLFVICVLALPSSLAGAQSATETVRSLNDPVDAYSAHELCRVAGGNYDVREKLARLIDGRSAWIVARAISYQPERAHLTAESTERMGAYIGTILIEVQVDPTNVSPEMTKGSRVIIEGNLRDNFFYGNAVDRCIISVEADRVTLSGF